MSGLVVQPTRIILFFFPFMQVIGSGVGGDMFSVNDLYIPRTPAKEKAQLHQVNTC
jgi:hypothetical protein